MQDVLVPVVSIAAPPAGSVVSDPFTLSGTFALPVDSAPVVSIVSPPAGSVVSDPFTVSGTFTVAAPVAVAVVGPRGSKVTGNADRTVTVTWTAFDGSMALTRRSPGLVDGTATVDGQLGTYTFTTAFTSDTDEVRVGVVVNASGAPFYLYATLPAPSMRVGLASETPVSGSFFVTLDLRGVTLANASFTVDDKLTSPVTMKSVNGTWTGIFDVSAFPEAVPFVVTVTAKTSAGATLTDARTLVVDNTPTKAITTRPYSVNTDGPMIFVDKTRESPNWHNLVVQTYTGAANDRQDAYKARLLKSISDYSTYFDRQNYSTAVVEVGADAEVHNIGYDDTLRSSTRTTIPSDWLDASYGAPASAMRVPPGFQRPTGNDGAVIFDDRARDRVVQWWRALNNGLVLPNRTGRVRAVDAGGRYSPYLAAHLGAIDGISQSWAGAFKYPHGTTACGILNGPGLIGIEEALQVVRNNDYTGIKHALYMCIPNSNSARYNSSRPFSSPANRTDGAAAQSDDAALPQGIRIRIAPEGRAGFDTSWTFASWRVGKHILTQAMCWAMLRHGWWVGDTTFTDNTFGGEKAQDHHIQWYDGDPWTEIMSGTAGYSVMATLPWERMEFMPHDYAGTRPA